MNIGYVMIIASMLIWGSIGIVVRGISQPPEVIVFFRVFIAFISMLIITRTKKGIEKIEKGNSIILLLVLSGVFLSLNWMFFFKAIKTTTVAAATLSYYTAPVLVTILSLTVLKEKLNIKTLFALILSFLGIFLMVFNFRSVSDIGSEGILYGLIAAFFYALVTISVKKLEGISSYNLVLFQTGISAILFMPSLRFIDKVDIGSIIQLIVIGTIHTSLALTLYFEGIKRVKVQHVGILSYIDPLSAVLFAFLFLQEIPDLLTGIGGVMILISTYIILGKSKK